MNKFPILNVLLFFLTLLTTLLAGMIQKGINPLNEPFRFYEGMPFAITLISILGTHELAHYFASKKHHTSATLPYFIPAPSFIGTFGAFIKMKSPITSRKALIDIGASGPIAGFIVSVFAVIIGLAMSEPVKMANDRLGLMLGDSILFSFLSRIIIGVPPEGYDILLNPVAFAGWIGFFVTALNLIPIGQLDGGHIAYAILGYRHITVSRVLIPLLIVFGLVFWEGWFLWAILLIILGTRHPPVIYWETHLPVSSKRIARISAIIFIVTFMPMPFKIL